MIYQVSSDGAIFPSDVNIVIYCIISRSHCLYDVQELKSKTIKELRETYISVCKLNYNEVSRFCFSKKEANQVSDFVTKTGFFPYREYQF